jgi:hypothetical protein
LIKGNYGVAWLEYSTVSEGSYGQLRYLVIEAAPIERPVLRD